MVYGTTILPQITRWVVRGVLCFPSIKPEVFKDSIDMETLLPPSEVTAQAEKAVVEGHTSLDFMHTLVPKPNLDWTMTNTSLNKRLISFLFWMGSKATV